MITLTFLLVILICVLVSVAFLTLMERKLLSLVGIRLGPNKVSVFGVLQPFGDALKLAGKQYNSLINFSLFFYYGSCMIMFSMSLFLWGCLWFSPTFMSLNVSFIFFMFFLSFASINCVFSGWSTFGKYTLMGALRSVAQLISYESSLYFCIFFFIFLYECFNISLISFLGSITFMMFPFCFYIWLPCFLSELNRTPFDFSEGESELVSGFNTDLGSSSFTLVFLSEYSNILFFCFLSAFLFFSNVYFFYSFLFLIFVIWIRSVLPRFRFDKLMILAWTFFIPFLTIYLLSLIFFFF